MSTFLELAQDVARESGTVSGTNPSAVTGQTGRLLKIVEWTAQAWTLIQNLHADWRFLRREFSGTTTAGSGAYTAASWNLDDFAQWITERHAATIYLTATGPSDERHLSEIDWQDYRRLYGRGTQVNNYPTHYAISPANEFCLGAIPNATYTVRGEYVRRPQVLAANTDEPLIPVRFHDIIVWRALMLLHGHDEGGFAFQNAAANFREMLEDLERDQRPRPRIGFHKLA